MQKVIVSNTDQIIVKKISFEFYTSIFADHECLTLAHALGAACILVKGDPDTFIHKIMGLLGKQHVEPELSLDTIKQYSS